MVNKHKKMKENMAAPGPETFEIKQVVMPLEGIHCASCVGKIESALSRLEGIDKVSIHLPTKMVFINYNEKFISAADIVDKIEEVGYKVLAVSSVAQREVEDIAMASIEKEKEIFFVKFAVSAVISLFLLSDFLIDYSPYTLMLLTTFVWLWCGSHFHIGFLKSLKAKTADMNTLVSLSSSVAYAHSVALTFSLLPGGAHSHYQWHEIAMLISFINLGRWLEARSKSKAGLAVSKLLKLAPKFARKIDADGDKLIPVEEIKMGDMIVLRPGEQVPLDGKIIKGYSAIDESFLTGESEPKDKGPSSKIYAGTINTSGALEFEVIAIGAEMALMKIVKAVRESQASKSSIQSTVDKISAYFVPAVFLIALGAFVFWFRDSGLSMAANVFAAVLASACPCAMGLAVPMAASVGFGRAAENGILINNADVFERVNKVNVVILDKTGTLTEGKNKIIKLTPYEMEEKEFVKFLISIQNKSEHPFAEAVRIYAAEKKIKPEESFSVEALPGRGISAIVDGESILCGSVALFKNKKIDIPQKAQHQLNEVKGSIMLLAIEDVFQGYVVLADEIREESIGLIKQLKMMDIMPIIASGDRQEVVEFVADKLKIDRYYAEILPEDKKQIVLKNKTFDNKVIMVGDGFNDAAALAEADIGIALASGSDIAISSSDITLMHNNLSAVVDAIKLSRIIHKIIKQNLVWAFVYNIMLIPLAAGVFYKPFGIILPVYFAGGAMAMSSVSVVMNSLRLRKIKL
ncbi:MAG: heavy metal translocating P-type ATPase [Elusimicrobia bacterium]|nr:heavy metal translocating P-type ATPase [Elusimicrobiota bacterium]